MLFEQTVRRVVQTQGPNGEWPWFFDVPTGSPVDLYPVYGVHQDSMAMLFLLPSLDAGVPGVAEAIRRSYAWVLGANQLNTPMIEFDPFIRFRSIERIGPMARPRRYARSMLPRIHLRARLGSYSDHVHINRECRSYEMGWLVYVWAGRSDVPVPKLADQQT